VLVAETVVDRLGRARGPVRSRLVAVAGTTPLPTS